MDDSQLVERARRGDLGAYEELVRAHQAAAFRAAYLITHDADDAEDAAQEAFIRAYHALGRFDTRRPFRPWLLRIAANSALNRIKASQRRQKMAERYGTGSVDVQNDAATIEAKVLKRERSQRVWNALGQLKPDDQRLLVLRYFLDLSEAELAQTFDVAAGTIKSRLHRALAKLRDLIGAHDPDLLEADR
ncbi:MAG TPA: RNA polymerase sigma factor [Anaerolineae bacterium]|nr:RNA polymerase sigma factor [Anaerolineae bacterium]